MFARSVARFALGALLCSTAACAVEQEGMDESDEEHDVATGTAALAGTPNANDSDVPRLGPVAGLGAPSHGDALDGLGREPLGILPIPAGPRPGSGLDADGPLEPPPFAIYGGGCYVKEILLYTPGRSSPTAIRVTVCN